MKFDDRRVVHEEEVSGSMVTQSLGLKKEVSSKKAREEAPEADATDKEDNLDDGG